MKSNEGLKTGNGGRKEVLTLELARRIVTLIEGMPDAGIHVSWDNVIQQVKLRLQLTLLRNVLSQKEWGGRKLIAEAFKEAKEIQRRLVKQEAPKYANSPRAMLRKRIVQLEAKVAVLQQELDASRAEHYTRLDLFRATRMDLRLMVEEAQQDKPS